jgi:sugar phosphate isomerase/epimerase
MNRRVFGLTALAGAAAVPALAAKKAKIGVQLYSVRQLAEKDTAGVLAGLAKAGYDGVEFAGFYGHSAADLRKILDANKLLCCGSHTPMEKMLGDEFMKTVEFNKTIGNDKLVVPWLPEKYRSSKQAWTDTAKMFNELSDKCKAQKMRLGYHNHEMEFKAMDGEMPWDTFFKNASKDIIMQVDTGNCMLGGGDPIPYIAKYPGRATTVHVKAFSKTKKDPLIGEDDVDWKKFLASCEKVGKTEWFIVEEESSAYPGLQAVEKSIVNLKKILG